MVISEGMYLRSLLNIPFGYCRVDQKYMVDIKDFMLVEILMCVLIVIMAKAIFEVKLSKLQMAIDQTEEAEKYMNIAKESLSHKQPFSRKLPDYFGLRKHSLSSLMESASSPRPLVAHVNAAQAVKLTPNSSNTNASIYNTSIKSLPDCESPNSSLDLASYKNSDPTLDNSTLPEETETKKYFQQPKTSLTKPSGHIRASLLNIILKPNQSRGSYTQNGANSTGTFTVGLNRSKSSNADQASTKSKSVPEVVNSDDDGDDQSSAGQEQGKVQKSLSQEYNPPVASKPAIIRGLRYSLKNAGCEKTPKGKTAEGNS